MTQCKCGCKFFARSAIIGYDGYVMTCEFNTCIRCQMVWVTEMGHHTTSVSVEDFEKKMSDWQPVR